MRSQKPAVSRLTKKYQATIPKRVRDALALEQGDLVSFQVDEEGRVVLEKMEPADLAHLEALSSTLGEWLSTEDDEAYGDL
jgi:antitoxin PrlF